MDKAGSYISQMIAARSAATKEPALSADSVTAINQTHAAIVGNNAEAEPPLKAAHAEGEDAAASAPGQDAEAALQQQLLNLLRAVRSRPLGEHGALPGLTVQPTEALCCALVCGSALVTNGVSSDPVKPPLGDMLRAVVDDLGPRTVDPAQVELWRSSAVAMINVARGVAGATIDRVIRPSEPAPLASGAPAAVRSNNQVPPVRHSAAAPAEAPQFPHPFNPGEKVLSAFQVFTITPSTCSWTTAGGISAFHKAFVDLLLERTGDAMVVHDVLTPTQIANVRRLSGFPSPQGDAMDRYIRVWLYAVTQNLNEDELLRRCGLNPAVILNSLPNSPGRATLPEGVLRTCPFGRMSINSNVLRYPPFRIKYELAFKPYPQVTDLYDTFPHEWNISRRILFKFSFGGQCFYCMTDLNGAPIHITAPEGHTSESDNIAHLMTFGDPPKGEVIDFACPELAGRNPKLVAPAPDVARLSPVEAEQNDLVKHIVAPAERLRDAMMGFPGLRGAFLCASTKQRRVIVHFVAYAIAVGKLGVRPRSAVDPEEAPAEAAPAETAE